MSQIQNLHMGIKPQWKKQQVIIGIGGWMKFPAAPKVEAKSLFI